MLSVTERAVYGASTSAVPQLSLKSKIVGLLTLKRPERAPTGQQLVDAPPAQSGPILYLPPLRCRGEVTMVCEPNDAETANHRFTAIAV
jgi:hypothetical protein